MKLQSALFCSADSEIKEGDGAVLSGRVMDIPAGLTCLVVLLTHWASLLMDLALPRYTSSPY